MNKKIDKKEIMVIIMIIISLLIGFIVKINDKGILFDRAILQFLDNISNDWIITIMNIISFFGSTIFLILMLLLLVYGYINKRERRNGRLIFISIAGSFLINGILKLFFNRTRPLDFMKAAASSYSYPSGHSMVSMSFYTTLAYILINKTIDPKKKKLIRLLNIIIVGLIGLSRMFLGVHWPTDVIGGYLLGYSVYYISTHLIRG